MDLGKTLYLLWLHLDIVAQLYIQRPLFQITSQSKILGKHVFWGLQFNSSHHVIGVLNKGRLKGKNSIEKYCTLVFHTDNIKPTQPKVHNTK